MSGLSQKNLDELLSIGGQNLVFELIQLYVSETQQIITNLNQAFEKDQQEVIGQIAHKLKSSSGSLGLIKLSELCFKLDSKRRNGGLITSSDVKELIEMIQSGCVLLLNYKKHNAKLIFLYFSK